MNRGIRVLVLSAMGLALASCVYPNAPGKYANPEYSGWPYERLDPDVYVTRGDHDRDFDRDRDHDNDHDHDFGHHGH